MSSEVSSESPSENKTPTLCCRSQVPFQLAAKGYDHDMPRSEHSSEVPSESCKYIMTCQCQVKFLLKFQVKVRRELCDA